MKLTVCFKTQPVTAMLAGGQMQAGPDLSIDLSYVKQEFNCFDESALELALRFNETANKQGELGALSAVTIDDQRADLFLKQLYAVGYGQAVRIQPPSNLDLRFNPSAVSALLTAYVQRQGGLDVLLLGWQSGVGDNRQTGFLLAERLGWPCIREVVGISPSDEPSHLRVVSRVPGGLLKQIVSPPVVLIIGNAPQAAYLRIPNLRRRLEANQRSVSLLTPTELGMSEADLAKDQPELQSLERPGPLGECHMLEGRDAAEKARYLYEQYLKEHLAP